VKQHRAKTQLRRAVAIIRELRRRLRLAEWGQRRAQGFWEPMPKVLAILALVVLAACAGHTPPHPVPTPPPVPPGTGPANPEMLLHADGTVLKTPDGAAFDFRGAVACCNTEAGEPNPKWPLGSTEWFDYLKAHGNVNAYHKRLGPWRTGPQDEAEWASTGGGYLEVNGKADLAQFNPAFWAAVDNLLTEAAKRGMWAEVDLVDGWGIKHVRMGDTPTYHPWNPANNVQGQDHASPTFDAVQEAWVRKAVQVVGRHGNVVFETSNEGGLMPGWNVAWEEAIIATVHDEETKRGYPRHLVSTNAERVVPSADWNEFHTGAEPHAPAGKVTGTNEYNPDPPLNGQQVADNYCAARASGTYYWLWRHSMTRAQWEVALAGVKAGCTGVGCSIPTTDVPQVTPRPGSGKQQDARNAFVDEAAAAVKAAHPELFNPAGALVGWPSEGAKQSAFAQPYFNLLVAYFRSKGACASAWEDSVAVGWRGDGWYEENHVLFFGDGTPIDGRHAYKFTWRFP